MLKRIIAFLVSMFMTISFTLRRASTGENNPNNEITIRENRFALENEFISQKREVSTLPTFKKERDKLPKPVWDGHDDAVNCLSLMCDARENTAEEPTVHISSDRPVTVEIIWDGGRQSKTVQVG